MFIFLQHFALDFYLVEHWHDTRLKYDMPNMDNDTYMPSDWKLMNEIWTPNLYFIESKFGFQHEIPEPNLMVAIKPDGNVMVHRR